MRKLHLGCRSHEVFAIEKRSVAVDFFLPKLNVAMECWRSDSRRGIALTWMERNAAYIDLKFRRLKEHYPELGCVAFVEAPQVDWASLEEVVGAVMIHADWVAYSMDELTPPYLDNPERCRPAKFHGQRMRDWDGNR